jgi:hypothetical protein
MNLVTDLIILYIVAFWWLIPLILLLSFFKTPWFKGWLGEFVMNTALKWKLDEDHYRVISRKNFK